jgi:uncharacterized integral membrane protein
LIREPIKSGLLVTSAVGVAAAVVAAAARVVASVLAKPNCLSSSFNGLAPPFSVFVWIQIILDYFKNYFCLNDEENQRLPILISVLIVFN